MSKETEHWDKAPDGQLKLCPVTGWTPFVPYGMACGLRLEFVRSEEHLVDVFQNNGKPDSAQIVLTPDQADELAQVLSRMAELARAKPPSGH